jgi:hypothetical protein
MAGRARSLGAFYGGPTWKAHAREANATMLDSANVLLLRPSRPGSAFSLDDRHRLSPGTAGGPPARLVIATLYYFDRAPSDDIIGELERDIASLWTTSGATILGRLVTETSANTFPALPVREGEHVFVVVTEFADADAYAHHLDELARSPRWRDRADELARQLLRPPETLRLSPTPRSML